MTRQTGFLEELLASSEQHIATMQGAEDAVLAPLLDFINLISNDMLRSFVRCALYNVAEQFWTMPSSPMPEAHPPDEYTEGGLVLHTKRVARTSLLIGESQMRIQEDLDTLVAAALIHDVSRADTAVPDYLHPIAVDKYIENLSLADELDPEYQTRSNTLSFIINYPEQLILLMRVVRAHEGIDSPCPEMVPVTSLEQILNVANQVAKNIDKIIDGHEIKEFRWRVEEDRSSTEDIEKKIITGED